MRVNSIVPSVALLLLCSCSSPTPPRYLLPISPPSSPPAALPPIPTQRRASAPPLPPSRTLPAAPFAPHLPSTLAVTLTTNIAIRPTLTHSNRFTGEHAQFVASWVVWDTNAWVPEFSTDGSNWVHCGNHFAIMPPREIRTSTNGPSPPYFHSTETGLSNWTKMFFVRLRKI